MENIVHQAIRNHKGKYRTMLIYINKVSQITEFPEQQTIKYQHNQQLLQSIINQISVSQREFVNLSVELEILNLELDHLILISLDDKSTYDTLVEIKKAAARIIQLNQSLHKSIVEQLDFIEKEKEHADGLLSVILEYEEIEAQQLSSGDGQNHSSNG